MKVRNVIIGGVVAVGLFFGGRALYNYMRPRLGIGRGKPKTQAELQASYARGTAEVARLLAALHVNGNVTGGSVDGKPAIIVKPDSMADMGVVHDRLPAVVQGMPVRVI